MQLFLEVSTAGHTQIDTGFWEKEKTLRACVHACVHDGEAESRGHTVFLWWWGQYLLIGMLNGQHNDLIPFVLGKSARVIHRLGVASLGAAACSRAPAGGRKASAALPAGPGGREAVPASLGCMRAACGGAWGCAGGPPPQGEGTVLTVTAQREGRAAAAEGAVFSGRLGRPLTGGQREGGRGMEQHQADSHDIP